MTPRPETSDFSVPVIRISKVNKHPNADTLSVTTVFGIDCVFKTGTLHEDELAVYVPVDAVVPLDNPAFSFLKKKESETTARIKAIRLRQVYSEGLLIPIKDFGDKQLQECEGQDISQILGITKYEEPERSSGPSLKGLAAKKIKMAPDFAVRPLLKNLHSFNELDRVMVTEKIHGCNIRFTFLSESMAKKNGVEPGLHVGSHKTWRKNKNPDSWLKAVGRGIKNAAKTFVRNIQDKDVLLQEVSTKTAESFFRNYNEARAFREDLWNKAVRTLEITEELRWIQNVVVYGELYGQVQDLHYGVDDTEIVKIRVFDMYDMNAEEWMDPKYVQDWCQKNGIEFVPVLFEGQFDLEKIKALAFEKTSTIDSGTIREGAVVRNLSSGNYSPFKLVSPTYKLRNGGTEYH